MAVKVAMPKLGLIMTEGVVVKWLKKDGEMVVKGEPVAVIMSKKITYEVPAPADGVFRWLAKLNATIPVTEAIAFVTAPGEQVPETGEPATAAPMAAGRGSDALIPMGVAQVAAPAGGHISATPSARRLAKELGVDIALVKGSGAEGRINETDVQRHAEELQKAQDVPASSMARKLAEQHGINLTLVQGTGPGGRVTEEDVNAFISQAQPPEVLPEKAAYKVKPFVGLRQVIAQRMMESLQSMAQVTANTEVDVTELVKMRTQIKTKFDLTYTDILIKAVTVALQDHPLLNATQVGDEIRMLEEMNIGVAVALDDGLIVPVVRNAGCKSLAEIAGETRQLAEKARNGTLSVDEISGGTFTITNLGTYGIDTSTPVINLPEVAILGVGRIIVKPAMYEGNIVPRSLMGLSLTFDHRVVDGAPAAAFLRTLSGLLEKPYLLFV